MRNTPQRARAIELLVRTLAAQHGNGVVRRVTELADFAAETGDVDMAALLLEVVRQINGENAGRGNRVN